MNTIDATAGMLIVGAGQAGVQAAEALRSGGYAGPVTLLGDEAHGPYHRPPLSKAWLAGEAEAAQLVMRSAEALARKGITLRSGVRVQSLDRAARRLRLADGSVLAYDGLVLATGARPRRLALPGADAIGVHLLRGRDDADALAAGLAACAERQAPVVVVGGGVIGLEVAATARKKGLAVTVLEAAPRLLGRMLAPALSDWFADLHRAHGVQLELGVALAAIETEQGRAVAVRASDGRCWPCGLVVVGIGVEASDELAAAAGLACERGIVVDDCARTEDPAIAAAGDCTVRRLADGSLLRLESVNNATEQGKCAAAALLGRPRPFAGTPWFWSDQYDRKLQIAGLMAGADLHVPRGDRQASSFSFWHFRAGRLLAVDTVNAAREHLLARKLLDAGRSPTPEQAADTGFDLNTLLASASIAAPVSGNLS
ncbi:NAD(P)/FAD-dependent oxidoreductase [Pseudorhodoferax sp.]|uniref:NAD(P)/FAD-dependent oxidoreductase n=1 Tax=Pseudorhodoferax sp. TaxID=1993553 RepID=UPI002DD685C2|nr:FAD-dependent oxidoreductase [Pseudorhodoferax sp.]